MASLHSTLHHSTAHCITLHHSTAHRITHKETQCIVCCFMLRVEGLIERVRISPQIQRRNCQENRLLLFLGIDCLHTHSLSSNCLCTVSDSSYSHPHTHPITCTCCHDEIKGTQDFSCSFSDSLSVILCIMLVAMMRLKELRTSRSILMPIL